MDSATVIVNAEQITEYSVFVLGVFIIISGNPVGEVDNPIDNRQIDAR